MLDIILDVLLDTAIDGLKMLPFLFGAYLLLEYIEHRAGDKLRHTLSHSGKYAIPLGACMGLLPQCGFSVASANLYAGKVISAGTLLAVFLSTSDEAIPVLLASGTGAPKILPLLALKLVFAVAFGYLTDYVIFHGSPEHCGPSHCHHDDEQEQAFECLCGHCGCEKGPIWKSALHHTIETFIFLLIVLLIINGVTAAIGEERLASIMLSGSFFSPFVAALVGLIPNCAPSVLISGLYLEGTLSLGATVAGLSAGAGLGLAMLFRINRDKKQNFRILILLYLSAVASGVLTELVTMLF